MEATLSGSRTARTWVLALTSLAALVVALDALVVTTALSAMRVDLHASIEELEWTLNAYTLSFAVLLMTASALGDRLGRRRLFVAGLAVFTAGWSRRAPSRAPAPRWSCPLPWRCSAPPSRPSVARRRSASSAG